MSLQEKLTREKKTLMINKIYDYFVNKKTLNEKLKEETKEKLTSILLEKTNLSLTEEEKKVLDKHNIRFYSVRVYLEQNQKQGFSICLNKPLYVQQIFLKEEEYNELKEMYDFVFTYPRARSYSSKRILNGYLQQLFLHVETLEEFKSLFPEISFDEIILKPTQHLSEEKRQEKIKKYKNSIYNLYGIQHESQ